MISLYFQPGHFHNIFKKKHLKYVIIKAEDIMYHISDLKKFLRCELLYYHGKDEKNVFKPYLRSDENIMDLLKQYLGIVTCFEGVRNDGNDHFFSNIDSYEWFIRPRFADGDMRINIPVMHKVESGFDLGFVYFGNAIKELDTLTYRTSCDLLAKLGITVNDIYLIYFNEDYVRRDDLDVQQLFVCTNMYKNNRIMDIVNRSNFRYEDVVRLMDQYVYDGKRPEKNRNCRQNGLCDYYGICFPDEEKLFDDSILSLVSSQYKNDMYDEGIVHLKDADVERLEGSRVQYAQIMASKNDGMYVDKVALTHWLEKLSARPISFIDFEWDRYLVPPYPGMRPLDVLPFEFALYYIDEDNHMQHYTFVSKGDCRREFIEALQKYLPDEGPVVAYNAYGAECLRLSELADVFEEYRGYLEEVNSRFVDLAEPFTEGLVYDVSMRGNYSLKQIVDICSDYSYKNLDIDDGMQAVFNWRDMDKSNGDEQRIRDNLEQYCSLDAYGLFLAYKWLIKLTIES